MKPVVVTDEVEAYMEGLLPKRDKVLARMEEEAHREGIPIVDPHEGALLGLLVRLAGAKRVLELGTATGYSGMWMLRGTEGGMLTSFEMDPARAARARANFAEAGFADRAVVLEQDALTGLEKLQGRFDACFIDLLTSFPSEDVTRSIVDLCIAHLDGGALLLADNALRQGEVVKPKSQQGRNVAFYNEMIARHPRVDSVIVPIRDGLSIARIKD
jgi:caffeoyl-CoA O-methyltransferase